MATPFFSLIAMNFFIGLIKGHSDLAPVSKEVRRLRYELHSVERKFSTGTGSVHPEAIADSSFEDHTVVPEWTALDEPDERKRQQIIACSRLTKEVVVTHAAVPANCAGRVSTWVIVRPDASSAFESFLCNSAIDVSKVMLSCMSVSEAGLQLDYRHGSLSGTKLSDLLSRSHTFRRCPRGYVRLSLGDLGPEAICEEIVQELVSRLARRSGPFDVESICQSLIRVWNKCPPNIQSPVRRAVRRVLELMQDHGYCARWLVRLDSTGMRWAFKESAHGELQRMISAIRADFDRFVDTLKGEETQPGLWE